VGRLLVDGLSSYVSWTYERQHSFPSCWTVVGVGRTPLIIKDTLIWTWKVAGRIAQLRKWWDDHAGERNMREMKRWSYQKLNLSLLSRRAQKTTLDKPPPNFLNFFPRNDAHPTVYFLCTEICLDIYTSWCCSSFLNNELYPDLRSAFIQL
jgi:hypothetical protein